MKQLIHVIGAFFIFPLWSYGQAISSDDKKAIKQYEVGLEYLSKRNFQLANQAFDEAIKIDQSFGAPYFKKIEITKTYGQQEEVFPILLSLKPYLRVADKPLWHTYYAEALMNRVDFELASATLDSLPENYSNQFVDQLRSKVLFFKERDASSEISIAELPEHLNQFGLQYFPTISPDEQKLYFTKRDGLDQSFDEDIYESELLLEGFSEPKSVSDVINDRNNQGSATFSLDGKTMIFSGCDWDIGFGSCDLYVSYWIEGEWSSPANLGQQINTRYWDSHPTLSPDGRFLIFSSDRRGGVGRKDLYWSEQVEGVWQTPKLIAEVNTISNEITPQFFKDGQMLFFASDRAGAFGGLDIYQATWNDGSLTDVQLLPYPINSVGNQYGFTLSATGDKAFYTYDQEDGSRLMTAKIDNDYLVTALKRVFVVVHDEASEQMIPANLNLTKQSYSDWTGGLLYFSKKDSLIKVKAEGYFPDRRYWKGEDSLLIALKPVFKGAKFTLEGVLFDQDKYELTDASKEALTDLLDFLRDNPKVAIEIGGHTDITGNPSYNLQLSENRAQEVYHFLIAQGISPSRLSYKGYGETSPLIFSDQTTQSLNRRVEVVIK